MEHTIGLSALLKTAHRLLYLKLLIVNFIYLEFG